MKATEDRPSAAPAGRHPCLLADELLLRALAEATEPVLIATDLRGLVTFFNAGAERLLGYRAADVVGRHRIDLFHEAGPAGPASAITEAFAEVIAASWDGRTAPHVRRWTYVRADGARVPVELALHAVRDGDGEPVGLLVVAEETADQDRSRHDFVATVSHDLRTPLTSVISCLELLADSAADRLDEQETGLLAAVHRNAHRMLDLVSDLLTLSVVEASTLTLRREPVSLTRVVERALAAVAPGVAGRHLDLRAVLPEEPLAVDGDVDYLERALVNLLTNAVKFTPDDGHIVVLAGRSGDCVVLRVTDTGVGIPAYELARVFQRFFRSALTRDEVPGTGLGLTIVKAVVEAHGGRIEVRSEQGAGTEFTVTLPARRADMDHAFSTK